MLSKVKLVLVRWAAEFGSLPRRFKQAAAGVLAVALVVGAVFLGRTIHHHIDQPGQPKKPSQVASGPQKPSTPKTPAKPAAPKSKSAKSSNAVAKNTQKSSSESKPGTSTAIPNTGPGNVVAIFAGASVVSALAHYGLKSRRQNS